MAPFARTGHESVHAGSLEPLSQFVPVPRDDCDVDDLTVDETLDRERIGGAGDEIDGHGHSRPDVTDRAGHELTGRGARRHG